MYDVVPDLLTAYWISLGAAFLVGAVIGGGIVYALLERRYKASGKGFLPCSEEPVTEPVEVDWEALLKDMQT